MDKERPVRPRFGVHWHDQIQRNGKWVSVCPFCGKEYRMVRKDFESFLLSVAACRHLEKEHYQGRREAREQ